MLFPEYIDWIDDCEWIEEIEPGVLGDNYIDETFRLKDGAPDDIKQRWEELCAMFRVAG
jgi:hypothetical protein